MPVAQGTDSYGWSHRALTIKVVQGTDSYGHSHRAQTAAGEGAEAVFTGLESPADGSFPFFPLYMGVSPLPDESLHVHVFLFFCLFF